MPPELRNFTPRVFVTMTLAAAVVLGAIVAIPQWLSKQARLEQLRANVAQTAQLAASAPVSVPPSGNGPWNSMTGATTAQS